MSKTKEALPVIKIGNNVLRTCKFIKVPFTTKTGETVMARTGLQLVLSNGERWFYHLKRRSWSRHMPDRVKRYRSLTPVYDNHGNVVTEPGKVFRFADDFELAERLKHCPDLVVSLIRVRDMFTWQ